MKKFDISILSILIIGAAVLFAGIFYISVLGENNKAALNAKQLFEDIKHNNYSNIQNYYMANAGPANKSVGDLIKFHFALELVLLEHFNLLDKNNYGVKIKRENLWVPFFKTNDLELSVSLFEQKESGDNYGYFRKIKQGPLRGLLIYGRESGQWKLKNIDLKSSSLQENFSKVIESIDLNKYITTTDNGFIINKGEIDITKLSPFEKRVLALNLEKALEILK